MMHLILAIALTAAVIWFWVDSARSRRLAIQAAEQLCRAHGLALEEAAIGVEWIRLRRTASGIGLCRRFGFLASRPCHQGYVELLDNQVTDARIESAVTARVSAREASSLGA